MATGTGAGAGGGGVGLGGETGLRARIEVRLKAPRHSTILMNSPSHLSPGHLGTRCNRLARRPHLGSNRRFWPVVLRNSRRRRGNLVAPSSRCRGRDLGRSSPLGGGSRSRGSGDISPPRWRRSQRRRRRLSPCRCSGGRAVGRGGGAVRVAVRVRCSNRGRDASSTSTSDSPRTSYTPSRLCEPIQRVSYRPCTRRELHVSVTQRALTESSTSPTSTIAERTSHERRGSRCRCRGRSRLLLDLLGLDCTPLLCVTWREEEGVARRGHGGQPTVERVRRPQYGRDSPSEMRRMVTERSPLAS